MSCIIERRDMLRYLRESNEDLQCQAADEIERLQSGCDNCLKQVLINSDTHQGEIKELSNKILEISLKNERLENGSNCVIENPEYEASTDCGSHQIESKNILTCSDTGRVIAVFYNDYDLNNLMKTIAQLQNELEAEY